MTTKRKPIAVYTLNNVSGIAIYDFDDEHVTAGLNDFEPEQFDLHYDDDGRAWFNWGGMVYLDECTKI